jgi:hypothetical protein
MQSIGPLNQAPRRGLIERILPITRRSNANMGGLVLRRAFCVATAIALLTARGSAAWAEVEDVGTPGPAILADASGSSGITNKADALRFDDARFAFRDPSVGSTLLSVGGRFVPIVGAGLEPSQEGQVDPGRPATAFDYNLSEDYYLGAPDAIPAAVKDFSAVDAFIQTDLMFNGAGDMITDPVGATGYSATIHGSLPVALSAGTVSPRRFHASCSGDGSTSAVIICRLSEIQSAIGTAAGGETGSSGDYRSGNQSFGPTSTSMSALGAPGGQIGIATATAPLVYFSVASPAVTNQVLDVVIPNVDSNSDPIVDTPAGLGIGDTTNGAPTPSVPEIPAPAMLVIGLGGIALAGRLRLRTSARFG